MSNFEMRVGDLSSSQILEMTNFVKNTSDTELVWEHFSKLLKDNIQITNTGNLHQMVTSQPIRIALTVVDSAKEATALYQVGETAEFTSQIMTTPLATDLLTHGLRESISLAGDELFVLYEVTMNFLAFTKLKGVHHTDTHGLVFLFELDTAAAKYPADFSTTHKFITWTQGNESPKFRKPIYKN